MAFKDISCLALVVILCKFGREHYEKDFCEIIFDMG